MLRDPILTTALALLLGATLGPDWPILPSTLVVLAALYALCWTRWLRPMLPHALVLLTLALGMALAARSVPPPLPAAAGELAITGEVVDVAQLADRTRVLVRAPAPPWPEDVVVLLPYATRVEVGETRRFRGQPLPTDDRGRTLGAAAQGVRMTLNRASVDPPTTPADPPMLLRLRRWIVAQQAAAHPGDAGALLTGLLTGGRSTMTTSSQGSLRTAGLAHIIAISGANFALVLDAVRRAIARMPRRTGALVLAAVALCFWLFVGGGMAVARAAVTALVAILAEQLGRRSGGARALVLCAAGLTLVSPLAPRADAGFQLSVLATAAVLLTGRLMRGRDAGVLEWRTTLATTLATTAMTLPVHLVSFGTLQPWAPVSNLLALPLVPLTMAAGALEFVLGWVPVLGLLLQGFTSVLLSMLLGIARLTAALPGANTTLPPLPGWSHGLLLAAGGALAVRLLLRPRPRGVSGGGAVVRGPRPRAASPGSAAAAGA